MKKITFILLLVLLSVTISACQRDSKTDNAPIKEIIQEEITKEDFTQGIWIKKYPDNYACFAIEKTNGYQIVCDPYNINDDIQPDLVIESHQHGDHTDTSTFTEPYDLIKEPGEYSYDNIQIRGFSGKHNIGDKEGTNTIYVLQIDDITIANFASQGELPSEELLQEIGPVDVLMIQMFMDTYYGKLEVKNIDPIVNALKPKIIIPIHGGYAMDEKLALQLNIDEVYKTSGNLIVTRDMLDSIEKIRLINLDNDW